MWPGPPEPDCQEFIGLAEKRLLMHRQAEARRFFQQKSQIIFQMLAVKLFVS